MPIQTTLMSPLAGVSHYNLEWLKCDLLQCYIRSEKAHELRRLIEFPLIASYSDFTKARTLRWSL